MKKRIFAYAKTKAQISFAVTAKLISAFVFATWIVQFLYFLYPEFPASSHLLRLYSWVCVGPGRKPCRPVFSRRCSHSCVVTHSNTSFEPLNLISVCRFEIISLLRKLGERLHFCGIAGEHISQY